jgi:hypothetical protein
VVDREHGLYFTPCLYYSLLGCNLDENILGDRGKQETEDDLLVGSQPILIGGINNAAGRVAVLL